MNGRQVGLSIQTRLAGYPMASPTLVPRFGGQSYRKLITAYPPSMRGAFLRLAPSQSLI